MLEAQGVTVRPIMNARHIGKNLRWGYGAIAIFLSLLFAAAVHSPAAGALSIPTIADVNLPISDTVLDKVVSPVTEQTNRLLPIDITSTPSTLGVQANLPLGGNSNQTPPINASVDVPIVPQTVNAVTDTLTRPLNNIPPRSDVPTLRTPPLQDFPQATPLPEGISGAFDQSSGVTTANTPVGSRPGANSQTRPADESPMPLSPVIFGMANFLGSGVPGGIQTVMDIGKNHPVNFTAIILSLIIFITTIAALFGTIYVIDHTSVLRYGSGRIAAFAQAHDVAQIASVVIVAAGAILVATFLVVKPF